VSKSTKKKGFFVSKFQTFPLGTADERLYFKILTSDMATIFCLQRDGKMDLMILI